MKILFYDVVDIPAYSHLTLQQTGMGGTEATIVRIAHALQNYYTIYIAQRNRQPNDSLISAGVHYISFAEAEQLSPDVVVLLRHHDWLKKTAKQFPHARLFFWMHNMPGHSLYGARSLFAKYQYEIIAVSHFHRQKIQKRLQGKWHQKLMRFRSQPNIAAHVIYNPIADELLPDQTPVNPYQLVSASTPYKDWLKP